MKKSEIDIIIDRSLVVRPDPTEDYWAYGFKFNWCIYGIKYDFFSGYKFFSHEAAVQGFKDWFVTERNLILQRAQNEYPRTVTVEL